MARYNSRELKLKPPAAANSYIYGQHFHFSLSCSMGLKPGVVVVVVCYCCFRINWSSLIIKVVRFRQTLWLLSSPLLEVAAGARLKCVRAHTALSKARTFCQSPGCANTAWMATSRKRSRAAVCASVSRLSPLQWQFLYRLRRVKERTRSADFLALFSTSARNYSNTSERALQNNLIE